MQAKRFLVFAIALFCAIGFAGVINQQDASAAKKTIKAKNVTLSKTSTTYALAVKKCKDGSIDVNPKIQKPSVKVKYGKKTLKKGKDYTVTYSSSVEWDTVGKKTVTVKGKGKYKGTVRKTFTIKPFKLTSSNTFVRAKDYYYLYEKFYTGKKTGPSATTFEVEHKIPGSKATGWLYYGEEYTVTKITYTKADWTKTGKATATLTIKGKGNYTGTAVVKVPYIIYPSKVSVTSYNATTKTITWNKAKGNFDGYHVWLLRHSNNGLYDMSKSYESYVSKDVTSDDISDVPNGKYTVMVSPYIKVDGEKIFSQENGEKVITLK